MLKINWQYQSLTNLQEITIFGVVESFYDTSSTNMRLLAESVYGI
jgi:hypothetical protein